MKIGGIVAEYNPFHNGHAYQIARFRQEHGVTHTVVVMSGDYVQRGDVAIVDKFRRSRMAVSGGANLVLELPVPYALSTAEYFALGGVYLLDSLGCVDSMSFGSGSDVETLTELADLSESLRNSDEVLTLMEGGVPFPAAVSRVVASRYGRELSSVLEDPNSVLGVEYVRALKRLHSRVEPTTLSRRLVDHHSDTPVGEYASASYVRERILSGEEYRTYVPPYTVEALGEGGLARIENLERAILYRLRTATLRDLQSTYDVSHGLEHRFLRVARQATSLEGLLMGVKTKRYTLARIRRIVLNLLLGITKEDVSVLPPYARVLAMDRKGVEVLSEAKRTATVPIGTSLARLARLSPECERFATLESLSTDVYHLSTDTTQPCGLDYTHRVEVLGERSSR